MGTIKTTNIETITGSGTLTLGQSGETITIPSGATLDLSNATQTGVGGVMTPVFEVGLSANQTGILNNSFTKVNFDSEIFDTNNCFASNKFTPNVAGKYFVYGQIHFQGSNQSITEALTSIYKNGSVYLPASGCSRQGYITTWLQYTLTEVAVSVSTIVDMNGTTDYLELYGYQYINVASINYSKARTFFGGYKIIE